MHSTNLYQCHFFKTILSLLWFCAQIVRLFDNYRIISIQILSFCKLMYRLLLFLNLGFFLGLCQCTGKSDCGQLVGSWSNGEGQEWIFTPKGEALLITRFGSKSDTDLCNFQLRCNNKPAILDLNNCKSGPYSGKSVFCIIDWTSDSTFRLRYEAGTQPDVRPTAFDPEQTVQFVRRAPN